jgi:dolichol-phosphate mannosyltransferase
MASARRRALFVAFRWSALPTRQQHSTERAAWCYHLPVPLPFAPSLTVVIPAYDERDNLSPVLAETLAYLDDAAPRARVLVVDDGSTDGTGDLVAEGERVRLIRHPENRGLTASLRTGFYAADTEFVTWLPADGQIAPAQVGRLLEVWRGEDLVLSTYRHRPDGLWRAAMSRTLRALLALSIGFRDRLEGTYLFRRALLDLFPLVARTSAGSIGFEIGVKTRRAGRAVGTTEIECRPRLSGRSKVANLRNVAATLGELWRIRRSL